ncbi:MAG: alpha/beta hydrolase [Bdellovibrionales bacterium]|nr:alpha/beta hydrolase [Bdellovibrionales bacterium]
MDLSGHGESGKTRIEYSSKLYADDIVAVANSLTAKNVILVGHSMSGSYVLEAAQFISNLKSIVVVDTLKNLDN